MKNTSCQRERLGCEHDNYNYNYNNYYYYYYYYYDKKAFYSTSYSTGRQRLTVKPPELRKLRINNAINRQLFND